MYYLCIHMEKELQITADGSHTLYIPAMDEHYHSVNGALQESRHIPASFRYDSCLELWGADLAGEKRVILSLA